MRILEVEYQCPNIDIRGHLPTILTAT
ncbi:hypothetical protein GQ600_22129 [Phytophthora cactorum]|nr:hypothetical protein GQ600_22129 [Phytophthora cactorum]